MAPRKSFEQELNRLESDMLAMASMVEESITESVAALKKRDFRRSRELIAQDREINKKRFAIEQACLVTIATQQPMASDLRFLAAILDITSELERIGDYAKGISRINLMIGEQPLLKPLIDVPVMAEKARSMLHQALDAFIQRDVELAHAIPLQDDEVDELYTHIYHELLTYIIEDQGTIEQANFLLWVAHNLERAADRVTNICERAIFTVTGEMKELDKNGSSVTDLA